MIFNEHDQDVLSVQLKDMATDMFYDNKITPLEDNGLGKKKM